MSTEGPFLCYRELISSTNVHLSIFFHNHGQEYLFVATISTISIYLIIRGSTEEVLLSLRTNHSLFGKVQDVKLITSQTEQLNLSMFQLTFDKGKFVIVAFDSILNTISERGIFNAEESALGSGAEVHASATGAILHTEPFSDVDPSSSISCNVVYSRQLLFLVLKDLIEPDHALLRVSSSPFLIDLQSQLLLPGHVIDMCFVPGFKEPTVAVLQATDFVPVGHSKQVMHSCTLSYLTVNVARRSMSLLWQRKDLPHDSLRLVKLTDSVMQGAVAVVTMNALLIVNESFAVGLAMNGFARTTVHPSIRLQPTVGQLPSGLELDASRWVECDPLCLAGSLKNGEIVTVQIVLNGKTSLGSASFEIDLIAKGLPSSSCLAVSSCRSLWLLGSRQSDALLLQVNMVHPPPPVEAAPLGSAIDTGVVGTSSNGAVEDSTVNESAASAGPAQKKTRRSSRFSAAPGIMEPATPIIRTPEMIDEEVFLYGAPLPVSDPLPNWTRGGRKVNLAVVDSIACLGPVTGGLFTSTDGEQIYDQNNMFDWSTVKKSSSKSLRPVPSNVNAKDARDCLLLASGVEGDGSLVRVNFGLRLNKLASREMPTAMGTVSLSIPGASYALMFISFPSKTRLFRASLSEPSHQSQKDANMTNLTFQELSVARLGLSASDDTLAVGLVNTENRVVVQVSSRGLRMIRLPASFGNTTGSAGAADDEQVAALQDMVLSDSVEIGGLGGDAGETIMQADVHDGWVSLLTSTRTVHLLRYDAADESLFIEHTGSVSTEQPFGDDFPSPDPLNIRQLMSGGPVHSALSAPNGHDNATAHIVSLTTFMSPYVTSVRLYHGVLPCADSTPVSSTTVRKPRAMSHVSTEAIEGDEVVAVISDADLRAMAAEEIFLYGAVLTPPVDSSATENESALITLPPTESASLPVKGSKASKKETTKAASKVKGKGKGKTAAMDVVEDAEAQAAEETGVVVSADSDASATDTSSNVTQLFVLITDARGFVSALPVSSPNKAWVVNLTSADSAVAFTKYSTSKHAHLLRAQLDTHDKLLFDTRLHTLSAKSTELDALCLTGIFDTGDSVVYFHTDSSSDTKNGSKSHGIFSKVEHTHVTSNRSSIRNKRGRPTTGFPDTPTTPNSAFLSQKVSLEDARLSRLESVDQIGSSSGVIVPGYRPLAVVNNKGRPAIVPLSFPELPYCNPGTYTLSSINILGLSALVTLWQETASEQTALRRNLGVYYTSADSTLYNNSLAVADKLEVNCTVNFISELLPRTDDKTEQALLQKKTYVMACSESIKKPFTNDVLTPEEMKIEEESYERFFYDLSSFCQPDTSLAPAPLLESPQHKLVLAQNGNAIDEYLLKENEQVLGLEVLYLTFEKYVDVPVPIHMLGFHKPPPVLQPFRRVFIAVSTLVEDKHGEDTQGEGRLLIFSLDYKLFETELEKAASAAAASAAAAVNSNSAEAIEDKESVADTANVMSSAPVKKEGVLLSTIITPDTNLAALLPGSNFTLTPNQPLPLGTGSSTQAQFLDSIQPKLRLHWQGPGPASAVRQMGQYIVSTIGYCVYIYKMNKDSLELEQISFHFAKFYISSITVVKNYIIIGNVCNCTEFLVWREADLSLTLLAQDFDPHLVLSTNTIIDGARLGILLSDAESNLQMLQFNPRKIESMDGSRLLTLADFHLGSDASVLLSHTVLAQPLSAGPRPPPPPPSGNRRLSRGANDLQPTAPFGSLLDKSAGHKTCTVVGTVDGGLGVLLPVDEKTYRSLSLLQQIMAMGVPTTCCLNQRDYRTIKTISVRLEKKRGVLDGTLLWRFASLPTSLQNDLAAVIGTSADAVLDSLSKLDAAISFF